MNTRNYPVHGAGLGLRRAFIGAVAEQPPTSVTFWEVAPENWIGLGGRWGKQFRAMTERHPFVCHGLSLSIGSPAPLDEEFVRRLKDFLDTHGIRAYSEHLSYSSDDGHLYDLMPIPFTEEAVHHVAERVRRVQDILERRIALENVSYYAAPNQEMCEIDFINAVLSEADCDLLLDVNNIHVNSINHRYSAVDSWRPCRANGSPTRMSPGTTKRPRTSASTPMARTSSTRSGISSTTPIDDSGSFRPYWSATSTSRRSKNW
jgi:uncharacterized protein (UPF0276 family)